MPRPMLYMDWLADSPRVDRPWQRLGSGCRLECVAHSHKHNKSHGPWASTRLRACACCHSSTATQRHISVCTRDGQTLLAALGGRATLVRPRRKKCLEHVNVGSGLLFMGLCGVRMTGMGSPKPPESTSEAGLPCTSRTKASPSITMCSEFRHWRDAWLRPCCATAVLRRLSCRPPSEVEPLSGLYIEAAKRALL
jgi:hypothetical protein